MPDDDGGQQASSQGETHTEALTREVAQDVRSTALRAALEIAKSTGVLSVDQVIGDARKIAAYITG